MTNAVTGLGSQPERLLMMGGMRTLIRNLLDAAYELGKNNHDDCPGNPREEGLEKYCFGCGDIAGCDTPPGICRHVTMMRETEYSLTECGE